MWRSLPADPHAGSPWAAHGSVVWGWRGRGAGCGSRKVALPFSPLAPRRWFRDHPAEPPSFQEQINPRLPPRAPPAPAAAAERVSPSGSDHVDGHRSHRVKGLLGQERVFSLSCSCQLADSSPARRPGCDKAVSLHATLVCLMERLSLGASLLQLGGRYQALLGFSVPVSH